MYKSDDQVLVPVYINIDAEIIVYRDINNSCFVWERTTEQSPKKGNITRKGNETN